MIEKIISGGQSGTDLLAIDWAKRNDILCEVNVEKNYSPLYNGIIPTGISINVVSDKRGYEGGWVERRRYSVEHSDFTLIFVKKDIYRTRGPLGTMTDCKRMNKFFSYINLSSVDSVDVGIVKKLFEKHNIRLLNIAGERTLNSIERDKMVKFLDMVILGSKIDNFE